MNVAPAVESPPLPRRIGRATVVAPQRTTVILGCITLVAAALRIWGLGHQSFWYDEGLTVMELRHSLGQMWGYLPIVESNPPVYYTAAWVWAHIFGYGETGLRLLSALAGIAAVPVIYGAGAKLVSPRVGLVAAALAAFNPFLIWYSQEARSYSLVVLFAAFAWLAFAHLISARPSSRWFVVWAVAAALTLATHYYGVLAVVPQAVWLLAVHRRSRAAWLALGAVGVVGLALLPLALSQESLGNWIATWSLGHRLEQMPAQTVLGTGAPARGWLKLAGALAVAIALILLAVRSDPGERRGALYAGALAAIGFLISLGLALAGIDNVIARNEIVVLIPLIVFVAGGLGARRAGRLGLLGASTLCAIGLIATIGVAVDWKLQKPAWRALARAISPTPPGGEGRAVIMQQDAGLYPLALYLPGLRFMHRKGARVRELDVIAAGGGTHGAWFCWWGAACNLVPSRLDTAFRIRGFQLAGPVLHVKQFSVLRLRAPAPRRLTPAEVARALRHSGVVYFLYQQPPA